MTTVTRVVACVVVAALLGGCANVLTGLIGGMSLPPRVDNRLDVDVELVLLEDDGETLLATLPSGRTLDLGGTAGIQLGPEVCTKVVLVARSSDGVEVDRHEPGLCADEIWEIRNPEG